MDGRYPDQRDDGDDLRGEATSTFMYIHLFIFLYMQSMREMATEAPRVSWTAGVI